jgi:hypothetical protein
MLVNVPDGAAEQELVLLVMLRHAYIQELNSKELLAGRSDDYSLDKVTHTIYALSW